MSLALDIILLCAKRLEGVKEIIGALEALDEALEDHQRIARVLNNVEPVAGNL